MKKELKKTLMFVVLLTAMTTTGTGAVASAVTPGSIECEGELPSATYGNVLVPPGATCVVRGAAVTGSLRVLTGARLFSFDSQVHGDIIGEGASSTRSVRNTVGGRFIVRNGGPDVAGPTALLCGSAVAGDAVIEGTVGGIGVRHAPLPGFDPPTAPQCGPNRIGGDLIVAHNTMTRPLLVLDNAVAGSAVVVNNTGDGGKTVTGNRVGSAMVCTGNSAPFDGSGNVASRFVGQCGP